MERPRCPAHGLALGHDGVCIRCAPARTKARGSSALVVVLGLVVAGTVAAMIGVRAVTTVRDVARQEPPAALPIAKPETIAAAPAGSEPAPPTESLAAARPVTVKLYSAGYCGWCRKAKAHMDQSGIAYTELRIDESAAAKSEMNRIGGNGVPTFDIEGDVHSGYNPAWVERTVQKHARGRTAVRH